MNRGHASADSWSLDIHIDREAVLSELRKVLASPHFCHSKRYPALLEYVVEHTLAQDAERLKERTLGIEIFGRPPDYDTGTDTIVRYTASEVRKRLLLYYSELDHTPAIRIVLPAGSYIPEFIFASRTQDQLNRDPNSRNKNQHGQDSTEPGQAGASAAKLPTNTANATSLDSPPSGPLYPVSAPTETASPARQSFHRLLSMRAVAVAVVLVVLGVVGWYVFRSARPAPGVLNQFWSPVLSGQNSVVICTGSNVFANSPSYSYSGTKTAGRDIDYTFVSMQIASAINQLGYTIDRTGDVSELLPSATTPLTQLREHSVILLGGYNNFWTMRLLQPLRFHFSSAPTEAIVDRTHPQTIWKRDESLPYSSANDYAIVARFRDPTIDGWVVGLAGIGRNGTEAAAHFVTDPHYIQLLRNRMDEGFANRNIEVVLKVNVINGKTGAPSILAIHTW